MANEPQTLSDIDQSLRQLYAENQERTAWLNTPHPWLNNATPMQFLEAGDADRVLDVLDALLTGAFM